MMATSRFLGARFLGECHAGDRVAGGGRARGICVMPRPIVVPRHMAGGTRRRPLRSVAAVLVGFLTVAVLSMATDQVFHALDVYPSWSHYDTAANVLALSYRCFYAVIGSALAARLAPRAPLSHAMAVGMIGFGLSLLGAVAAIAVNMTSVWLPVALTLTTLPCAFLGGVVWHPRRA
jgi:hypothetical protein